MGSDTTIAAVTRKSKGKSAMGRLRRAGLIPAIVYGAESAERLIELNGHDFVLMLNRHASEHLIADLSIDGENSLKALVKEVQRHPVTGDILHVDFQAISMQEKLRVHLAVELLGEPTGVTLQGGILEHLLREIEIECLPGDMLEEIEADVSRLQIGESLLVGDIPLDPAKYKLVTDAKIGVAAVVAPRVQAAAAAEEEGEEKQKEENVDKAEAAKD